MAIPAGARRPHGPRLQAPLRASPMAKCDSGLKRHVHGIRSRETDPGRETPNGTQVEELESLVLQAGTEIDRHVLDMLHVKYRFTAHCDAIKRYLLLGQVSLLPPAQAVEFSIDIGSSWVQGDFVEALMDSVGPELGQPGRMISEFALNGLLDSAIRASSAQYDHPEHLGRLRIKLDGGERANPASTGAPLG